MTRVEEIINFAVELRRFHGTNNPYKIAEYYGFNVNECVGVRNYRAAYTIKAEGYPTIISISSYYPEKSKRILCAHELGHALLHDEGYNPYDVTGSIKYSSEEYEANIFALALLADGKALEQIKQLSPYAAKMYLDKKIVKE